jgi:type II secretory pathway pseudopilin PulG
MRLRGQQGYAMAALLVGMAVMAVVMSAAMPVWKTAAQREKEAELIFRGQQYVRAIELYQRKLPGATPPSLDVLLDQRFLRKKYKDPITGDDFELLSPNAPMAGLAPPGAPAGRGAPPTGRGAPPTGRGTVSSPVATSARGGFQGGTIGAQPGISGVASKSKATSLRLYNGRSHYNEWQFVYVPRAAAPGAGAPGVAVPGQRGGPGGLQPGVGPGGRGRGDGRGFPPGRGDGRGGPPPGGRGPFGPGGGPFQPGVQPFPQQPQRPPG